MTTKAIEARRELARRLRQGDRAMAAAHAVAVATKRPDQVTTVSTYSTARIGFVGNHR